MGGPCLPWSPRTLLQLLTSQGQCHTQHGDGGPRGGSRSHRHCYRGSQLCHGMGARPNLDLSPSRHNNPSGSEGIAMPSLTIWSNSAPAGRRCKGRGRYRGPKEQSPEPNLSGWRKGGVPGKPACPTTHRDKFSGHKLQFISASNLTVRIEVANPFLRIASIICGNSKHTLPKSFFAISFKKKQNSFLSCQSGLKPRAGAHQGTLLTVCTEEVPRARARSALSIHPGP